MTLVVVLSAMMLMPLENTAQTRSGITVSGKVTDVSKQPVVGAVAKAGHQLTHNQGATPLSSFVKKAPKNP